MTSRCTFHKYGLQCKFCAGHNGGHELAAPVKPSEHEIEGIEPNAFHELAQRVLQLEKYTKQLQERAEWHSAFFFWVWAAVLGTWIFERFFR